MTGLLISVYEKASVEAAAADGLDDPIRNGLGWLFALLRYDQEQYEQYLNGSHDGFSVFAQDGEWYYCYATATDARFYFGGGKLPIEEALAQWEMLNDQVCPSVRDDFMERNGLTPYSDKVIADDPGNDRPTIPDDLPLIWNIFTISDSRSDTTAALRLIFHLLRLGVRSRRTARCPCLKNIRRRANRQTSLSMTETAWYLICTSSTDMSSNRALWWSAPILTNRTMWNIYPICGPIWKASGQTGISRSAAAKRSFCRPIQATCTSLSKGTRSQACLPVNEEPNVGVAITHMHGSRLPRRATSSGTSRFI